MLALDRLWQNDFEYWGAQGDVAHAWWQVHFNVVKAFGVEDWRSPEGVDLEWHGIDFTEAAIEIRRTWYSSAGVAGPDEDFMHSWQNACTWASPVTVEGF